LRQLKLRAHTKIHRRIPLYPTLPTERDPK
jgi:hypothetical protein